VKVYCFSKNWPNSFDPRMVPEHVAMIRKTIFEAWLLSLQSCFLPLGWSSLAVAKLHQLVQLAQNCAILSEKNIMDILLMVCCYALPI
jgi:hypothetical protein